MFVDNTAKAVGKMRVLTCELGIWSAFRSD